MGNNELTSYIISIVASVFGAVLAVRTFGHWGKSEWGKLVTCLLGAAVAAFCIFSTQKAISILSFLGEKLASVFPT
ncbi:hypothetical protein [Streptomyces qinglanensis]|uniref:hypothetical protein n=1 Tax=Streptomyces qinglanensis TaxID=943816 RepID=UPI003D71EAAC